MSNDLDNLPATIRRKIDSVRDILRELQSVVVAFSGGVDSTLLLQLSIEELGKENVLAAHAVSPIFPHHEREEAVSLVSQIGAKLVEIAPSVLDNPNFASNPPDRCYHCKHELFGQFKTLAKQRGLQWVVSGTNADDTGDFRPGLKAETELGIRRPLMEVGLTKDEIRQISRAMGLGTWSKGSMACLASRIPYGTPITGEKLSRIERAEGVLRDLGFSQYRIRDHETVARIEIPRKEFDLITRDREEIVEAIKGVGYTYVALDLQGFRSGSMNETLGR